MLISPDCIGDSKTLLLEAGVASYNKPGVRSGTAVRDCSVLFRSLVGLYNQCGILLRANAV